MSIYFFLLCCSEDTEQKIPELPCILTPLITIYT